MKKLLYISAFTVHSNLFCMITYMHELLSNTAADSTKIDTACDFYQFETYDSNGNKRKIISYFDLKKHEELIPFEPNDGAHDFRPLETLYCQEAQSKMKSYKVHRGKIGLFAGFCFGTALGSTFLKHLKKSRPPSKD